VPVLRAFPKPTRTGQKKSSAEESSRSFAEKDLQAAVGAYAREAPPNACRQNQADLKPPGKAEAPERQPQLKRN
jgi:hypothetical protein